MRSYALSELSWSEVVTHLETERRLILPVATCDQYGPHLPIGASRFVTEALSGELSREFGIILAPTFSYGVNVPSEKDYPGTAGLRGKTLHRALNELIASWEQNGFDEFVLITASEDDPHVEAMAAVYARQARIRVIEALAMNLSEYLRAPPTPQHGGETMTSLLLHLQPEVVRMEAARDYPMDRERFRRFRRGRLRMLPVGCEGSIGFPSLATAETGAAIFSHILERIREKVFISPEAGKP